MKNARLQTLKIEFDAMRMKEEEALDQYAGRISSMTVRYVNLGSKLEDVTMVKKVFNTVPDQYLYVIAGIEQFCGIDNMPFEEEDRRLKTFEECACPRAPGGSGGKDRHLFLTHSEWWAKEQRREPI